MRCPRCRHQNRETARFCGECGSSLARGITCPRCAAVNPGEHPFCDACGTRLATLVEERKRDPRAYTPRHLIEKILTTRRTLAGERKQVTVLFADMVDSMQLAGRVDPEEWHRLLDRFFVILAEGVHRFEGTINQFTGDGVMALFGAPVAHEDHAQRACHAALHVLRELEVYARTLEARGLAFAVRVGLNSGEVVVGTIGDDLRMDYTALGQTVGLAARLQQVAAPGTVYLTGTTARMVDGFFVVRDLGEATLKGMSGPLPVFELRGIGPFRTRLDASRVRRFSRLVGRERELAWLDDLLARALASDGQVVGVVGDPGVGKSRVCLEFVERCRGRGLLVHEAHCPTYGATLPLLPMRELLCSCFAIEAGDSPDVVREKVGAGLRDLDLGFDDARSLVLEVLGVAGPTVTGTASDPGRLAVLLRRYIRLRSDAEPVVLLLDDVHWIDPASDAVVAELAAGARETRTLLLLNFRPGYRPSWAAEPHYRQLALAPLDQPASRALLDDLLGADDSVAALAELIWQRTGGNPFFIEEVVQALAGTATLVGERGGYRMTAPLETLTIPVTVQALLAARIDRLGEGAKRVLQAAAVIGKQFDATLLREVVEVDESDLTAALGGLEDAEFIHRLGPSPEVGHGFKHPLTCDVAYHSQLGETRARLHARVAAGLEKLRADRLGECASLIAHHWQASGMRFEAARWERRAALNVSRIKVGGRRKTPT